MDTLLKQYQESGEEIWLIIDGEYYYCSIKEVTNTLVTFTYQRYSEKTKAYSLWQRTMQLDTIDGYEIKLGSVYEDVSKTIKNIVEVEQNGSDARN